jgi:hypothetical protein
MKMHQRLLPLLALGLVLPPVLYAEGPSPAPWSTASLPSPVVSVIGSGVYVFDD